MAMKDDDDADIVIIFRQTVTVALRRPEKRTVRGGCVLKQTILWSYEDNISISTTKYRQPYGLTD